MTDFYCDVALRHPERLDLVHEDDEVLAFRHTNPYWPTHVVVVPKRHIESLTTATAADSVVIAALLNVVQRVARDVEGMHGEATVLTNVGAAQSNSHLHVHVYQGERIR